VNNTNDFRLNFDWQDPGGAKGKELRATWASLSIVIDDQPATEILDRKTKTVRDSVFLPLFPLAEWIANNWWFLQVEADGPNQSTGNSFDRRHNLRWAREGFVLPSLRFITLGQHITAQWQPLEIFDAGIRFLAGGSALIPAGLFNERLREFVNSVIARLDQMNVTETTLHEQWAAVENADVDERKFCCAAARMGEDPYAIGEELQAKILNAGRMIRNDLLDDFLSLANIDRFDIEASALKVASESIYTNSDHIDALATLRKHAPSLETFERPWETGYWFADRLRKLLGGSHWKSQNLDQLAGHLGIDHLDRCLLPQNDDCNFLDALTGSNQQNVPKFIIQKNGAESKQFAFCRAMFEHLIAPSGRFAAVSQLRTEQQQMNRAFAAEFLAPHLSLKNDISAGTVGDEEISDLAADYGVSPLVIRHQIENHHLARVLI